MGEKRIRERGEVLEDVFVDFLISGEGSGERKLWLGKRGDRTFIIFRCFLLEGDSGKKIGCVHMNICG